MEAAGHGNLHGVLGEVGPRVRLPGLKRTNLMPGLLARDRDLAEKVATSFWVGRSSCATAQRWFRSANSFFLGKPVHELLCLREPVRLQRVLGLQGADLFARAL